MAEAYAATVTPDIRYAADAAYRSRPAVKPDLDLLLDGPPLTPGAAAAALLVTPDGRYLLQHRDDLPGIFFPGWWGLFGGAIDPGETPDQALLRELDEELGLTPGAIRPFCVLGLDFSFSPHGQADRHIFEVPIEIRDVENMNLGEGQGMELVSARDVMGTRPVIPYDATVIWQHATRHRFVDAR